jgi:hypothetical protein
MRPHISNASSIALADAIRAWASCQRAKGLSVLEINEVGTLFPLLRALPSVSQRPALICTTTSRFGPKSEGMHSAAAQPPEAFQQEVCIFLDMITARSHSAGSG